MIVTTYLAEEYAFEIGYFEGTLAALGITEYAKDSYTSHFKSYTFVTTKENDSFINNLCKKQKLHIRRGRVRISISE